MRRPHLAAALGLGLPLGPAACECMGRPPVDEGWTSSSTGLGASETTAFATTAADTESAFDPSRFFGIFHGELPFTPFGYEGYDLGGAILANVEIRADGTAGMVWEICSVSHGTTEIAWRWEAQADDWLELTPGPAEGSLRWLGYTDLESLRATIDEQCVMRFEIDGELIDDPFRLGEACWVIRCEGGRTHVDHCELPVPECG